MQPTPTRGRITVEATGDSRVFMFNPNEINDDKQISWGALDIPGASHPVYQYGTGGERLISFDLYLDGDRGRYGRETSRESLSIAEDIKFYRSLVYPGNYDSNDFAAVYPYIILFSFGEYCDALPCIVRLPPAVKISYWTPKLEPVRASIALGLAEVTDKSQTADDVLGRPSRSVRKAFPFDPEVAAKRRGKIMRMPVQNIVGGQHRLEPFNTSLYSREATPGVSLNRPIDKNLLYRPTNQSVQGRPTKPKEGVYLYRKPLTQY